MFHMEVFRSSLSSGVTNVFQQVTYVTAGSVLTGLNNGVQIPPELTFLHSFGGIGATLENLKPQANSWLPAPFPEFAPNNVGTAAGTPPKLWDFSRNPKAFRPTEEFDMYASQTSAGAEVEAVFFNICDGPATPLPPVSSQPTLNGVGQFFVAHGTATTTLTANAWTSVIPILDQALPAGRYALVGARVMTAHALAFRVKPTVQPLWRPGGLAVQSAGSFDPPGQRYINPLTGQITHWGTWVTFYQNTVPQVDIWATAADTTEDIFFDLIKISDIVTGGL